MARQTDQYGVLPARFRFPRVPQHPDGTREVLGNDGLDGLGNGWAEIQPGEMVRRHPLPAGEHGIAGVEHGGGPLPYLGLKNEIDDVAVRRQALADDHQRADTGVEAELFLDLAEQGRIARLVALEAATGHQPVALAPLQASDWLHLSAPDQRRPPPQPR